MKMLSSKVSSLFVVVIMCISAPSISRAWDTHEEKTFGASSVWSSWYWPVSESYGPALYSSGESMELYDDYHIKSNYSEGAQYWEENNHGEYPGVEGWEGHCHAWSNAAIWEPQPTVTETHSGVDFKIRHLKGLLTEIYYRDFYKEGYWNNRQFGYPTPEPGLFWKILRDEMLGIDPYPTGGVPLPKPLIVDLSETDEVWNHPVFRYEVDYSGTSPNIHGRFIIYYALDVARTGDPGFVSGDPRDKYANVTGSYYRVQAYYFKDVAMLGGEPDPSSGKWTVAEGAPPSSIRWPDNVWRGKSRLLEFSGSWSAFKDNPKLDDEYLRVILGTCAANEIFVDKDTTKPGTGTLLHPFKTVKEGTDEVCSGGTMNIVTGVYNEKLTISKKMTIKKAGGAVVIKGN